MTHVHTVLCTFMCACGLYLPMYACINCMCVIISVANTHSLSHTHIQYLSGRVRFPPNGTTGTQDISILKGDISQPEPCSKLQPDHSDSLTAEYAVQSADTWQCGSRHNRNVGKISIEFDLEKHLSSHSGNPVTWEWICNLICEISVKYDLWSRKCVHLHMRFLLGQWPERWGCTPVQCSKNPTVHVWWSMHQLAD